MHSRAIRTVIFTATVLTMMHRSDAVHQVAAVVEHHERPAIVQVVGGATSSTECEHEKTEVHAADDDQEPP